MDEHAILLACVDVDWDEGARLRRSLTGFDRWAELVACALRHAMIVLLQRAITVYCPDLVPPATARRLAALRQANAARALRMTSQLLAALEEFRRAGIPAMAFKGPSLAEHAYGDVTARQVGDLDILVPRRSVEAAREVLGRRGFVTVRGDPSAPRFFANEREVMMHHPSLDLLVELHWRTGSRFRHAAFSSEELLDRGRPGTLLGREVLSLHPEDLFFVLAAHGANHQWDRLEGIATLAAVLHKEPATDWRLRLRHAADRGCLYRTLTGIALVVAASPRPLPAGLDETLAGHPRARRLAAEALARTCRSSVPSGLAPGVSGLLWQARSLDSSVDMALELALTVVRPGRRDWQWLSLPTALSPLYYLVRPLRAAVQYRGRAR